MAPEVSVNNASQASSILTSLVWGSVQLKERSQLVCVEGLFQGVQHLGADLNESMKELPPVKDLVRQICGAAWTRLLKTTLKQSLAQWVT